MNDPNLQQPHTFGDSPAAERLWKEMKSGANYRPAVVMLNKAQTRANELIYAKLPPGSAKFFLQLMRREFIRSVNECKSDQIIKSLCKNVFATKYRFLCKLSMFK